MKKLNADYMITATTNFPFTCDGIKRAQKSSASLIRALRYKYPDLRYIATMGVTDKGFIHYHILCRGQMPKKSWLKSKWHHTTGCFYVDVRAANINHPFYAVVKNALNIPDIRDTAPYGFRFQRIRSSEKLFTAALKNGQPNTKHLMFVPDTAA